MLDWSLGIIVNSFKIKCAHVFLVLGLYWHHDVALYSGSGLLWYCVKYADVHNQKTPRHLNKV